MTAGSRLILILNIFTKRRYIRAKAPNLIQHLFAPVACQTAARVAITGGDGRQTPSDHFAYLLFDFVTPISFFLISALAAAEETGLRTR